MPAEAPSAVPVEAAVEAPDRAAGRTPVAAFVEAPVRAPAPGPERARAPMPDEFDPERRGQDAPRPPGGRDPDPDLTARKERRVLWLLVLMIALLIGIPTLVGIFGLIVVALGGTT